MIRWAGYVAACLVVAWCLGGRMAAVGVGLMAAGIGFEAWRTWPEIPEWWAGMSKWREPPDA